MFSAYSGVLFLLCFSSSCVLAVSLSCPYLIDTSVFSNVYLLLTAMYVNSICLRMVELTIRKLKIKQVRICIDKGPFKEGGGGCLLLCMNNRSCTLL